MQGSVRQRGRGVWEVRVYVGRDERTGRKRYRSRTVRGSRRDADQVCRDLVESSESERDAPGPEELPTVGEWIDEWWPEKKKAISPTTASSWQSVIDIYVRPRLGEMPLHEVRARHLESLYRELLDGGLGAVAVSKVHTVASVVFEAAARRELIASSPAILAQPPLIPREQPRAPTTEEVNAIVKAAAEDPETYALVVVAANTGARRGELCALRWCDVDFTKRTVTIARAVAKGAGTGAVVRQTKTGAVGRVALGSNALAALERLRDLRQEQLRVVDAELSPAGFIWSQDAIGERPIYPDTMSSRYAKFRAQTGLMHVELRQFRHFAATQLLSSGVNIRTVSGRLRHSRAATTLDRYAAWVPARDREAADILDNVG